MKLLKDCEYTAFISYAHADDDAWYGWVTCFRNELERGLRALLRGVPLPRLHLSGENGPVAGALSEELKKRVEASFAMIIVVHENYAQSSWCLKELEYFRAVWGDEGFRERLYIVALSESAMLQVTASGDWKRLLPNDDQLWVPFYDPADKTRPLDIYMGPGLVANAFRAPFERLRSDFAAKLRRAAAEGPGGPPTVVTATAVSGAAPAPAAATVSAAAALPGATIPAGAAVAAVSGFAASTGAASVGAPASTGVAAAGGVVLFGFVPPASADAAAAAVARVGALGIGARLLATDTVFTDFADFAHAGRLVLAFDDQPPMMGSMAAGGHLQLQREAWLRKDRPADRLHWLDLRGTPAPAATPGGAAAYVAALGEPVLDIDALAALLRPPTASPAPALHTSVRIYIESNRNERTLWEPLGEQIRRTWDTIARTVAPERIPPLTLRTRGLPVDQIDSFPNLDDADGVVLLWGMKTSDALVAQINKVENKMAAGRDAAPGIVAYLMPPQQTSDAIPAWGWQVLRFDARDEESIDVLDEDRDELRRFLRRALRRWQQREGGEGG